MFTPYPFTRIKKYRGAVLCLVVLLKLSAISAQTVQLSSSEILQNIKKLNVLGSVLYIAAHPDDENTLMLAYLSKDQMARTAYLSLTRGDGGQNLIGPEQGYNIGIIRTQELLAARRIDGAQQFFSRAYDFGFSKTKDETLRFWNETKVLGDVVWLIRSYQPDVIITRFPPDERAGHGHHQTSAFLAEKAFQISDDLNAYPEQLSRVKPWKAKRIYWNSYTRGFTNEAPDDTSRSFIPVELGGFNPLIGSSYSEIAAVSRSQHKSQGFGVSPVRDKRTDFLLHTDGAPAQKTLFEGIDITWNRIKGGAEIEKMVSRLIRQYNVARPDASIPELISLYQAIDKLDERNVYVASKKNEVKELILQCAGLWLECNTGDYSYIPGDKASLKITAINRSDFPVRLISIGWTGSASDSLLTTLLEKDRARTLPVTVTIPKEIAITQPYWLEKPMERGMFQIDDQQKIGPPENNPETITRFTLEIAGQRLNYTRPWVYKTNDPIDGEIYRPLEIRPLATANLSDRVYIFTTSSPKDIMVTVKANRKGVKGKLRLEIPASWRVSPEHIDIELADKYQEQTYSFKVTPPATHQEGQLSAVIQIDGQSFSRSLKTIAYPHIPTQTLFPPAEARIARTEVKATARKVGYIAGAGDDVPSALRQIGCTVIMLDEAELNKDLSSYDAIVVGVRAYNTEERLRYNQPKLMDYVKNGGTLVVQYVTPGNLKTADIGPYPLTIGRDRVSEEDAEIRPLIPQHRLLTYPNKIDQTDFANWIQERGLYFADKWDPAYQAILSSNDTGETPKNGSLLYAPYGKGHFIYTGLSFFRELPAGVPGAYRLFANLISIGK